MSEHRWLEQVCRKHETVRWYGEESDTEMDCPWCRIADLKRRNAAHLRTIDGLNEVIGFWERALRDRMLYHAACDRLGAAEREALHSLDQVRLRVSQFIAERDARKERENG